MKTASCALDFVARLTDRQLVHDFVHSARPPRPVRLSRLAKLKKAIKQQKGGTQAHHA